MKSLLALLPFAFREMAVPSVIAVCIAPSAEEGSGNRQRPIGLLSEFVRRLLAVENSILALRQSKINTPFRVGTAIASMPSLNYGHCTITVFWNWNPRGLHFATLTVPFG